MKKLNLSLVLSALLVSFIGCGDGGTPAVVNTPVTPLQPLFYAISGTLAQTYVDRMIKGENIHAIGVAPRVDFGANGRSIGIFVDEVTAGMLASNIGIKAGDQIYELGGSRLWDDGTLNEEGVRRVETLEKYCSILKTFNPKQGSIIRIELMRSALNGQRVSYIGEINGDSLTLSNNRTIRCPD